MMIIKLLWRNFPFNFHHRALLVDSNWDVSSVVEPKDLVNIWSQSKKLPSELRGNY